MAHVSDEDNPNDIVLTSLSLTAETTTGTTQLPTLPFDVLPEILCRLPVKLLVQLRCLCKFFNSVISDPKFAKKHLQLSTKRHHLMVTSIQPPHPAKKHYDSLLLSVFSTSTVIAQTQLYPSFSTLTDGYKFVDLTCCCDGIFCCYLENDSYFLWNPSINKVKLLPPLENPAEDDPMLVSFGYDHFIDNYKVVAVSVKKKLVFILWELIIGNK
uniref:F-box domain-containing protein n=1 Tax=Medicago truncatula TaxID=3880 RepID=I3SVX0_MEDTR|nr:unknown [Medicago truncatula]